MAFQVTEVKKCLSGFDYPGSPDQPAQHAQQHGAGSELVGLNKDSFDGPSAVKQAGCPGCTRRLDVLNA